jgi:tetratricopeptide (TPR) repeat protein
MSMSFARRTGIGIRRLMSQRVLSCTIYGLSIYIAAAHAEETPWAVPGAAYRAAVRLKEAPEIPEAGSAIELPEFAQLSLSTAAPVLVDAAGKNLPLFVVGLTSGKAMLLLAKDLPPGADCFLYFGGRRSPTGASFTPKLSLIMETRRLPERAKFDSWTNMRDAWQRAAGSMDGVGFVPSIYHGANPFGASVNFLSHYTGYLRTGAARTIYLYTMSSDASFVLVNDRFEFDWPGSHSPAADADTVRGKTVACSPGWTKIDYYQAKFADGQPAAVLGWKQDGKLAPIPPNAWMQPGTTEIRRIEEAGGRPVPAPKVEVKTYLGIDEQFYYETSFSLPRERLEGWETQWTFEDGAAFTGPDCVRVIPGDSPRSVTVRLKRGKEELRGVRRWDYADPLPAASINNPNDRDRYLALIERETPAGLSLPTLRADLMFLRDYASDLKTGEFARAFLQKGVKPEDAMWAFAQIARLRALAQTDASQAAAELRGIDRNAREKNAQSFDLFEMELLAFYLRDPAAIPRLERIAFQNPNSEMEIIARIRAGDLYRLLGRYPEAMAQYRRAQKPSADDSRKLPTQDRAYSLTINDLLRRGEQLLAQSKLSEWELRHPTGKFENDFLLLWARLLMWHGRWNEALMELESFAKIQPDNPYQIEADFYRARSLFELGKKDDARKIWLGIHEKYPLHELAAPSQEWARKP